MTILTFNLNPIINLTDEHRPDLEVEVLQNLVTLSGETVLPGFVLNLQTIW